MATFGTWHAPHIDLQQSFLGLATLSLETQPDIAPPNVLTYIEQNFAAFLTTLRLLSIEDQELVLAYYMLEKSQATLALLHRSTQTMVSSRVRAAIEKLGSFILLGPPPPEVLCAAFTAIGMENTLDKPLSQVVTMYARLRDFQRVSEVMGLERPNLRPRMQRAAKALTLSEDTRQRAVGVWLHDLIHAVSVHGRGFALHKEAKQGHAYMTNPGILGEFRIRVEDPDYEQLFTARARCD